ncbi:MAG: Uma2 family endonuclease [Anaerolineae bacterium]|nr:Uma2 family endonuclease [Anaerolineae bacterium]
MISDLRRSPGLPLIVEQFQTILQSEHERRQQFYEELQETQKAEFINGEIVMQSPVKMRHSNASENLFTLFKVYIHKHQLGYVGHEKILVTLTRNDYEPDICFFGTAKAQAFTPDQMKFPAPDFVAEVLSRSTEAVDRGIKFEDYALHGVEEYWLVDPVQEFVEQYVLQESIYTLITKSKTGTIDSVAVKGLNIPVRAIFDAGEHISALQAIVMRTAED